jgi:hypothetical protein
VAVVRIELSRIPAQRTASRHWPTDRAGAAHGNPGVGEAIADVITKLIVWAPPGLEKLRNEVSAGVLEMLECFCASAREGPVAALRGSRRHFACGSRSRGKRRPRQKAKGSRKRSRPRFCKNLAIARGCEGRLHLPRAAALAGEARFPTLRLHQLRAAFCRCLHSSVCLTTGRPDLAALRGRKDWRRDSGNCCSLCIGAPVYEGILVRAQSGRYKSAAGTTVGSTTRRIPRCAPSAAV